MFVAASAIIWGCNGGLCKILVLALPLGNNLVFHFETFMFKFIANLTQ